MIKVRITGTKKDIEDAVVLLRTLEATSITSESKLYENRGRSDRYRVYLECEFNPRDSICNLSNNSRL